MTSAPASDRPPPAPFDDRLDDAFGRLRRSAFRRSFRLREPEIDYLRRKGLETLSEHAARFVAQRLAPAYPANDGRQTPYRNHPVFVAQHATATCCRKCLARWHGIPRGRALTETQQHYAVAAIDRWLREQLAYRALRRPSERSR